MGKGIAYQFKLRYPENNKDYIRVCKNGDLHIGSIHSYYENKKLIVNFPTKNKWREKSQMSYIKIGLDLLVELIKNENIQSIAIPPLGCGNGGLIWEEVKKLIEEKLFEISNKCNIIVFEPSIVNKGYAKDMPKLSVASLALLQMKMHLDKWSFLRMQYTGFLINYYMKEEYFKFDKGKYEPYSSSIDIIAKDIREYQRHYGLKSSCDTYKNIYQVIVSKKTENKLKKILLAIKKATDYVNSIEDDCNLEGVITVLYLIWNNDDINEEKLLRLFECFPEDKLLRFTKHNILYFLNYLVETGIVSKNLFGFYELNEYNY